MSHHEPGGLATREVLSLVQELDGDLVAADVVEYNPRRDIGGLTATVAAKIVKEVAGRMMAEVRDPRRSPYCLTQVGRRSWVTPATSSRTISP